MFFRDSPNPFNSTKIFRHRVIHHASLDDLSSIGRAAQRRGRMDAPRRRASIASGHRQSIARFATGTSRPREHGSPSTA
jgi:hypothetical protein